MNTSSFIQFRGSTIPPLIFLLFKQTKVKNLTTGEEEKLLF